MIITFWMKIRFAKGWLIIVDDVYSTKSDTESEFITRKYTIPIAANLSSILKDTACVKKTKKVKCFSTGSSKICLINKN